MNSLNPNVSKDVLNIQNKQYFDKTPLYMLVSGLYDWSWLLKLAVTSEQQYST